mgnify:CR=1 FL=1
MTQNPQVSATVPKEIHDQIVLLAEKESRSVSSMVSVLLTNAIKERNRKKKSSIEAAN